MATNMVICNVSNDAGQVVGVLAAAAKNFSTGSTGFYGNGKCVIDGASYTMAVTFVKIGSKTAAAAPAPIKVEGAQPQAVIANGPSREAVAAAHSKASADANKGKGMTTNAQRIAAERIAAGK